MVKRTGWCHYFQRFPASNAHRRYGYRSFFLTFIRATIAGVLALMLVLVSGTIRPRVTQVVSLISVSLGVIIGFPLLTALALKHVSSAHSLVFTGLLPLCTAVFGVLRGGERPRMAFWVCSVIGSLLIAGFALSADASVSQTGDLLMLASVIACGFGYAEGAKLSREMGGWQVISWALIFSLPFMAIASGLTMQAGFIYIGYEAWFSLGYVSLFSMFLGFVFWYRGLAAVGVAAVGQLQLLQPFIGLCLSVALLHERVTPLMALVTLGVILCVAGAHKFAR